MHFTYITGSTSAEADANASDLDYDPDLDVKDESLDDIIQIQVTNEQGINNHLENIR